MSFHLGEQGALAPRMWRQFIFEYYETEKINVEPIELLLQRLKCNLDKESRQDIDTYLYRVIYAVLLNETRTYCLPENWDRLANKREKIDLQKIPPYSKEFYGSEYLEIYDNGLKFLPEYIQKKLTGTDFIDGGAFIGDSIRVLIKYQPSRIFAFEPNNTNRLKLIQNGTKYHWNGIVPIDKGLSDLKTHASIDLNGSMSQVNIDNGGGGRKESIELTDIDSFVNENNVNLGVIKLDVEGMELRIIKGAIESIKKYKPVLLISIYHTPDDFFRIKPLIEDLNLGYKFLVRKLAPSRMFSETMLIGYVSF
jgi:FkbM family methyltransferase